MKRTIKQIILTIIIAAFAALTSMAQDEAGKTRPTLRGDKAISKLKQNGQYDSLMQAVKQSRKQNGQTDETNVAPDAPEAVGQNTKLVASDGAGSDYFGVSVAVSGDTAIVGAYQDTIGANFGQGSAYVFVRSGTTWSQQAQLTATGGAANDFFGRSVGISGNTAIVGAFNDDVGANTDQGSAYVFVRSGTTWSQLANGVNEPLAPTATNQGAAYFFINQPAVVTAASVTVSGRVVTDNGRGLVNANVYLTDASGATRAARTSSFGYYRFDDIAAGQTVTMSVASKKYRFTGQVVNLGDSLTDVNFAGSPR